jgi:lipopolysaccharide export system permease protein
VNLLFITASRLGDAVLSTGILAALIERHPGIEVTVACGSLPAPLFRAIPNVSRIIELNKSPMAGHWRRLWMETIDIYWDIVVDLRQSAVSRLIRARRRYIWKKHPLRVHKVMELAATAQILPLPAPRLWHGENALRQAETLVPGDRPVLALAPGAQSVGKKWPADRYAEAARAIIAEDGCLPGARVLLVGDARDYETCAPIRALLVPGDVIDLTGQTDIALAAACLARASLYIGNDSGLTHVAAACGIRTLALFGPGVAWKYRPWGDHAAYLSQADDPARDHDLCRDGDDEAALNLMRRLTVEEVVAAADRLWHKSLP